jgi:kumamolisin
MKDHFSSIFRYFMLLMLALTLHVDAAPVSASPRPSVRLSGHVPSKAVANAVFVKNLTASVPIAVTFVLPLRNQEELVELVQRIHDPADQEHYGKYLTSEEFVERFSPSQKDYNKVIAYAKRLGLKVSSTHPNRTLLNVSGPAGSIETAFNLQLHQYQLASGRKFHAPNNNPEVPASIASVISGIVGLDNHAVWRPYHQQRQTTETFQDSNKASQTSPSGPGGGYSPEDLTKAYNLTAVSANGTGQIIALFELAGYQASDINQYTKYFSLPSAKLHNVLVDGGSSSGIDPEVTLDIELAIALAPQSQIYVYEGPNSNQGVLDTYNRIATDNIAKQVSTSWGMGEDLESTQFLQAENAIFLQMAAHGQTIYAAAGDSGAYDDSNKSTPVVDDPASQPYIVGVGGTRLTVNPGTCAYENESVWNNGLGNGAGGGGVSVVWPIPSWQTSVSTAYSKTHRNVPDVSLNADPDTGYSIYYKGQWTIYGGTSCAAPLWAAFTACVNQERAANQKPVLGFANPSIYSIGGGSSYTVDFHDVTQGNNLHYSANTGYDNATGWGSFNGANLFASLTNSSPTPPPPPHLSPLLNITMTHSSPFNKGGIGTYQIGVSNQGNGSTSGPVNVVIALPAGITYRSFVGSGWTFNKNTLTFTQDNVLESGSSYPPITLSVNVEKKAPYSVVPTATVLGGGSVSSTTSNLTTFK